MGTIHIWLVINTTLDFFFFVDMIIIFNSAYYDKYLKIVDDKCIIAKRYLSGWFSIDLISIIPFDIIFSELHLNGLVRVVKIGKLYKLIKITRLLRLLKILKEQKRFFKILNEYMQLGLGLERYIFFAMLSVIGIHIVTCLWIIFPQTVDSDHTITYKGTWMEGMHDKSNFEIYSVSFYWCITTITTVGYGDILPTTIFEKLFCSLIMIFGVVGFSFATGSLTSILSNLDSTNAKTKVQLDILDKINKEHQLPLDLYVSLKKNIEFK